MALIRCYSDNNQIHEALNLIDEMIENNLEPKLRTYHPILEAVCKKTDFTQALFVIKEIKKQNIILRPEQLALLLEVGVKSGCLYEKISRKELDLVLESAALDLLGVCESLSVFMYMIYIDIRMYVYFCVCV